MEYRKRYVEEEIKRQLRISAIVVVVGPKYCGKTTTSSLFAKSVYSLDDRNSVFRAQNEPENVLNGGESPRLIDEWQEAPDLWNKARTIVDRRGGKGHFIFTGSATPADPNEILHDGSGRVSYVFMRPLSLFESGESNGLISMKDLFEGNDPWDASPSILQSQSLSIDDLAFLICRGGWPDSLLDDKQDALDTTANYFDGIFRFQNSSNEKFRNKKPETLRTILRCYARNVSTEARRTLMINDIASREDRTMDDETFDDYLEALHDLYIISDLEHWSPNLRSKTATIKTPTRHFVDTSSACAVLGITPASLSNDLQTFGMFFEDFAIRDLSIYLQSLKGYLRHFRTSSGLECDAIAFLREDHYGLIEIKLGGVSAIQKAEANLLRIEQELIGGGSNPPAFKMILTGIGVPMKLKSGVLVAPINTIKA